MVTKRLRKPPRKIQFPSQLQNHYIDERNVLSVRKKIRDVNWRYFAVFFIIFKHTQQIHCF